MNATYQILLPRGEHHRHDLALGTSAFVRMQSGRAWVTMESDRNDYVLGADQCVRFAGPGRIVVSGLTDRNLFLVETRLDPPPESILSELHAVPGYERTA